ncbi:hypothetical protein Bca4012_001572 [Brassica carinata]
MDGGGITIRYKGVTVHTPKTWHDLYVKRKPKLYLMHAAFEELKIRATSSVSELQRSTPSSDVNMTAEFELELQELFNDVKSMVKE